jgi:hypothetical protein
MLNITELTKPFKKRQELEQQAYTCILKRCHKRIEDASKNLNRSCYYDVPSFLLGYHIYNLSDCIKFLIKRLTQNNFDVEFRYPKLLKISWEKHYDDYVRPVKQHHVLVKNPVPRVETEHVPNSTIPHKSLDYSRFEPIPLDWSPQSFFSDELELRAIPPPSLNDLPLPKISKPRVIKNPTKSIPLPSKRKPVKPVKPVQPVQPVKPVNKYRVSFN